MTRLRVDAIPDEALGNTSYLVEAGQGLAVSIDARRDVDEHRTLAEERGLRIVAALETHLHADFVSGSTELAHDGAEVIAASQAGLRFAHRGVRPGETFALGECTVEVIATPGHTPEHVAYLVRTEGERAVFTGGSLIAGGAARTDLTGEERAEELARAQYASLRTLAALPGDTAVYPTHGGGSFCSTGPARTAASTIGDERRTNPLLGAGDERAFVDALARGLGTYPPYFNYLREINLEGAELVAALAPVRELSAAEARAAGHGGAWLIDGRAIDRWTRAHAAGSVSIELRPAFASWLGWVVPFGEPFVLVLDREHLDQAVRLARRIGYDAIVGWLRFESWRDAGYEVASVPEVEPEDAFDRAKDGATLLDVRQANEFAARHIAGAAHMELGDVIAGKTPHAREVIAYCGHGERSATAVSILERRGVTVANLRGGSSAWRAAGLPLEP